MSSELVKQYIIGDLSTVAVGEFLAVTGKFVGVVPAPEGFVIDKGFMAVTLHSRSNWRTASREQSELIPVEIYRRVAMPEGMVAQRRLNVLALLPEIGIGDIWILSSRSGDAFPEWRGKVIHPLRVVEAESNGENILTQTGALLFTLNGEDLGRVLAIKKETREDNR